MNPNPFVTVWTQPRETIRRIISTDPKQHVWTIALLLGAIQGVNGAINSPEITEQFGVETPIFMVGAAVIVAVFCVFMLWLGSIFTRWMGSWIGGQSNTVNVRAAIAWSYVPNLAVSILSLILTIFFREEMRAAAGDSPVSSPVTVALTVISFVVAIWTFVIASKMLAEVQGFQSAWKGFLNLIMPVLVFLVPIVLIGILASVVLVNLESAREKGREAAAESQRKLDGIQMELDELETEEILQQ